MKYLATILLILLPLVSVAEPLPYFEMVQVTTNNGPESTGVAVSVTGFLLTETNVYLQATNLSGVLQTNYFNGLASKTHIHWHDHFHPASCYLDFICEHSSDKDKTKNYLVLEEDIENPSRYISEKWILRIIDDADAKKKEKAVKDFRPGKKWKPVEVHLEDEQ